MYPYFISGALSVNDSLPAFPSSTAPHYAADVSNAPAKRKRVEPAPYDGTAHTETTHYSAAAMPLLPDPLLYDLFSNDAFSPSANVDFMDGSSQTFVTTEGSIDASLQSIMPQYLQEQAQPSKRRRVSQMTSKRGRASNAPPNNSVLPRPSIPAEAMFTYPAHVLPPFTPSTVTGSPFYESFVEGFSKDLSTPNTLQFGETAMVPLPSPGAYGATYPHYNPDSFINPPSLSDYELPPQSTEPPPKRRRRSNAPSKRVRVPNARPRDLALPGASIPDDATFMYPAGVLPSNSFTPSPAGSFHFYESFVQGSSKDVPTPNALLDETAVRPPPPGAFSSAYPHCASDLARTFDFPSLEPPSLESFLTWHPTKIPELTNKVSLDHELPSFDSGNSVIDFPGVGDDSWGTAYNTPIHLSARVPSASGSSHSLTSNNQDDVSADGPTVPDTSRSLQSTDLTSHTALTPLTCPLENGPPEEGVSLRRHPSGIVTYFDPHKASSPLLPGTRLQLACWHPKEDTRVLCLYLDPFADKSERCNKDYVNFSKWRRHFGSHSIAEQKYVEAHQEARKRAVAIKDPQFADVHTWVCDRCGTRGSKSDRKWPLARHKTTTKCETLAEAREHKNLKREREYGAW